MLGAIGGLLGTLVMSAIEIVPWRKWGLPGVFEWHENQMLIVRFLRLENDEACLHYLGIFGLHLTNGILGGIGFYLAIEFIVYLTILPIPLLAMLYSFFLWIVTLVPIHKPITGLNPWNHPLGHGPALASLAGHFAYGLVLSLLFLGFT
ncbi:MAG TPA: hypothetical protein VJ225_03660 [Nitrososphaeraceae archaeon]|nr:hypothetical protein [Nitrososphaeraceae archaeon]